MELEDLLKATAYPSSNICQPEGEGSTSCVAFIAADVPPHADSEKGVVSEISTSVKPTEEESKDVLDVQPFTLHVLNLSLLTNNKLFRLLM